MSDAALPATFATFQPPARPQAIQKIRYSHDAMIDMIVHNPWISQGELALNFGYTEGWVSQVIASDAFQARLAERKNELIDPAIRATIEERFKGLVARSIEILMRKLEKTDVSDELALKALEVAGKCAGYGAKNTNVQVNTQFVVQVPAKSASTADWARDHGSAGSTVDRPPLAKGTQISDAEVLVSPGPGGPPLSLLDQLRRA